MSPIKSFLGNVFMSTVFGIAGILIVLKYLQFIFGGSPPLLLFLVVIAIAAWCGGLRAGLFATTLSAAASSYLLLAPYGSFFIDHPGEILSIVLLVTVGAIFSLIIARLYNQEKRALQSVLEREVSILDRVLLCIVPFRPNVMVRSSCS